MPEMQEYMYCSQQICIPPTFPYILRQYAKAAIRSQPYDLLRWSTAYFRAMSLSLPPPVKPRLEYPIPKTYFGMTPGWLRALLNQMVGSRTVSFKVLLDRWTGACLSEDSLIEILLLGGFRDKHHIPWNRFMGLCAGHLCENLTNTMIMVCELLTEEPEGGSAMITLEMFADIYFFLALVDASKPRIIKNAIWKESVTALVKAEELEQQEVQMDIMAYLQSLKAGDEWPSPHEASKDYPYSGEMMTERTTQSKDTEAAQGVSDTDRTAQKSSTARSVSPSVTIENEDGVVVPLPAETEEAKPQQPVQVKRVNTPKIIAELSDEITELARKNEELLKKSGVSIDTDATSPRFMDVQTGHFNTPQTSAKGGASSSAHSHHDRERELKKTDLDAATERSSVDSQVGSSVTDELLQEFVIPPVPGIGPAVPRELVEAVMVFMKESAARQQGMVMPRNIRHFTCPPLEVMEQ